MSATSKNPMLAAQALLREKKFPEAKKIYETLLKNDAPAEVFNNLGVLCSETNELWSAEKYLWHAQTKLPCIEYRKNYLVVLVKSKQIQYAHRYLSSNFSDSERDTLKSLVQALKNSENKATHKKKKAFVENQTCQLELKKYLTKNARVREDYIEKIVKKYYKDTLSASLVTADFFIKLKSFDIALRYYENVLRIDSENHHANAQSGAILLLLGRVIDANSRLEKAVKTNPADPSILANLATTHKKLGNLRTAENTYRKSLELDKDNTETLSALGATYAALGDFEEANRIYSKALAINPDAYSALVNYSSYLSHKLQYGQALTTLLKAKKIRAEPTLLNNIANTVCHYGAINDAFRYANESLSAFPEYPEGISNRLFISNYHPELSDADRFKLYEQFGTLNWKKPTSLALSTAVGRTTSNEIRIGFVSGDFNSHPLYNFLHCLLTEDRSPLIFFAYSNNPITDSYTTFYKSRFDYWRDVHSLDDSALALRIRNDAIDFLIDLSGHTAHHRLNMFRIKPAKVSATWIGYNYTTGLKEIDYFITDDYQVLPTTKQFYSESILSLGETAYCFTPRDDFFCPDKLPMLTRGFITFGSFSRGIRLNPRVLDLWSKILAAIPRSRLKFDSRSFADFSVCAFFKNEFQSRGISPDRIDFGHTKLSQAMSEVDIVLDTFPHNSGTTLFETVYCGRPFVTMSGNLSLGRLGGSILKNLRLDQFISECEDDYIESAVNLSSQKNMLRDVSEFIRTEISKSPLMNSPKFMERFKAIVSQLTNN